MIQALPHYRASREIFEAMQQAARSPGHQAQFGDEDLVVGTSSRDAVTVYVSEYFTSIRQTARRRILPRLARIAVVGLAAAAALILRIAARMPIPASATAPGYSRPS